MTHRCDTHMFTTLKQLSTIWHLPATSFSHLRSHTVTKKGLHLHKNLAGPPQTTMPDFKSGWTAFVTSLHSWPTSALSHRLPWSSKVTCMSSDNVQGKNWGVSDLAEIFTCTCPNLFSQQNVAIQQASLSFSSFPFLTIWPPYKFFAVPHTNSIHSSLISVKVWSPNESRI